MIPDTANRAALPALTLLLYGVRSPINLGMILRVAETYGVDVATMDGGDLTTEEGKRRTVSDFACGALQRKGFTEPSSLNELSAGGTRRLIATSIEDGASSLPGFQFVRGDVVVLGNEYDGLPADVFDGCTLRIKIPMADVWTPKPASHNPIDPARVAPVARDGMPNLNVAMAAGIICYQWFVGQDRDQSESARERAS